MEDQMEKMAALNRLPPELREEKTTVDQNRLFNYDDIANGHIRQEIVVSEKLRVVFQTLNGSEDEWLKDQTSPMAGRSVDYVSTWYRNSELALGLVSITLMGKDLDIPAVHFENPKGAHFPVPTPETVERRRITILTALPVTAINKLQLHYGWFLERATLDIAGGSLKNG